MKRMVLIAAISLVAWMIAAPFVFPDPGRQVRDGEQVARQACIEGKAINAAQQRLCRIIR